MSKPLLIVHGIGNRSRTQFEKTTEYLRNKLGGDRKVIHVFWGDIGGIGEDLEVTLPGLMPADGPDGRETRSVQASATLDPASIIAGRVTGPDASGNQVRSVPVDQKIDADIRAAVQGTAYLKEMDDPEVLEAVGDLLAAALRAPPQAGENEVRGWVDDIVGPVIRAADELIGKVTGQLGGSLNQLLRKKMAVPVSLTFGDVVAYHQNRACIHARLFDLLDAQAPGYGGADDKRVDVLAHSLGGLLALEAALGVEQRQLWIDKLVTFGSQPAFFHVMTPRGKLTPYAPGQRVRLPSTIRHWTNLWHRLDLLAFMASPVFELHDGSKVEEVDVVSSGSEIAEAKGWLHSCYWNSPKLLDAL